MHKIIYCPVCGSNIKFHKICPVCGYQMDKDYEMNPTLEVIPRHCESIPSKRRNWEKQQLKKDMDELLHEMKEKISDLEKKIVSIKTEGISSTEEGIKEKYLKDKTNVEENPGSKIPVAGIAALTSVLKLALSTMNNSTCTFGSYKHNSDGTVRPILWQVLEVDQANNKALLISKYALDCQPYNTTRADVTWETCTLRNWLNSTFLSTAFSDKERAMILKATVSADSNPDFLTDQGNSTKDQIFLLSIQEVRQYFSTDEERQCTPTAYAVKQGAWISSKQDDRKMGVWWLRSLGSSSSIAAYVFDDGYVSAYGDVVFNSNVGVRPALWVNLESGTR